MFRNKNKIFYNGNFLSYPGTFSSGDSLVGFYIVRKNLSGGKLSITNLIKLCGGRKILCIFVAEGVG